MIFDIFTDLFKKKKKIPMPWAKFYREEELNFKIPDIICCDKALFCDSSLFLSFFYIYNKSTNYGSNVQL